MSRARNCVEIRACRAECQSEAELGAAFQTEIDHPGDASLDPHRARRGA